MFLNLVIHLHAVLTLYAINVMEWELVLASKDIKEIHTKVVDLNVYLVLIVQLINHA